MNSSFSSGMARMSLRVGYGFHPTDEELVNYYLKLKNQGRDDDIRTIAVVDIYKYEPWDLPVLSEVKSSDRVWYFFSPRDYKYGKSKRYNRTTREGYWKSTGKHRKVMAKSNKKQIGTKRTLVFHIGHPKGTRTGWVMQEYEHDQGNLVLCKLKRKPDEKTSKGEPDQWTAVVASDVQNQDLSPMTANSLHQQVYHMTYEVDDQRLNKVNATSNDESSHSIPRFENQTSVTGDCTLPMVILSDSEHQSPHKKGGCLMTSNLENQIITYGEGESSLMVTPSDSNQTPDGKGGWFLDSYFENEISPYVKGDGILISTFKNQISVCGDGEFSPLAISSDFRSKYPYEMDDCLLASDLEDPISGVDFKYLLTSFSRPPSDFKEQSIYEKDDCLKTSDLQNPISDAELEQHEQNYPIPQPCLEDQSTFYKG
uniref:NAC domain-containing protein n=2 Tax=Rhizophora mucronata TaxID=61149 RepID=A0A2P2LNM2_RHIMU